MFQLAREHADAAARAARRTPPDRQEEQTHSLLALLMSYFALEAFINMVGADRLGDRFRHYDRMSPEGKWVEVTRLVSKTGKTFPEDGEELRALSSLRAWRNMLTHYKGEYEGVNQSARGGETRIEALLSAENAARAVETAQSLYRAFYEMDRRSPPRQFLWLDDRPHRPRASTAPAADVPQASRRPSRRRRRRR
jgi:predicted dehydrogenase